MIIRFIAQGAALSAVLWTVPLKAQDAKAASRDGSPSAGLELWSSTDSDGTDVIKLLVRGAWRDSGPYRYSGLAVEKVWLRPQGQQTRQDSRIYADLADSAGDELLWRARIGTDGHSWLGSAGLRTKDWSKELFLEREIVETARGIDERIYYTFVGGSFDVPLSEKRTLTVAGAVQAFTGRNERLHIRASYVQVVKPDLGLSVHLRGRYFHSTAPGEFDYYSPRNFVQILPVVQMRRFTRSGWMLLAAAGYGGQKATGSEWQSARLADIRFESPTGAKNFSAFGQVQYSNSSLSGSGDYHHWIARLGFTKRFSSGTNGLRSTLQP